MAIDYKKEWEKLQESTGGCTIIKNETGTTLDVITDAQIKKTIGKREALMKEYLKAGMKTDITGGSEDCHRVHISLWHNVFATVSISKKDFAEWCEKKGGK